MCVSASATVHPSGPARSSDELRPAPYVTIPYVQEAIFYLLSEERVQIVITAVVNTACPKPTDVWFAHEAAVECDDMTTTILEPESDPLASAIHTFVGETDKTHGVGFVGIPKQHRSAKPPPHVAITVPPEASPNDKLDPGAPFTCVGFGPVPPASRECPTAYVVRYGITIANEAFGRLVNKINGSPHYFYGINGPAIVLDDICYSHIPCAPAHLKQKYSLMFKQLLQKAHVAIRTYEILTFDPEGSETAIRYDRGLAQAHLMRRNVPLKKEGLGRFAVTAWQSETERFVILRGSVYNEG